MKAFLSGNEAIAAGAFENRVRFAAGYPGTPATEILETMVRYPAIRSQWSANEKVALDVAVGASLGGVRALVAMKHVGLNVASDTLMTLAYTGIHAGLVIVVVDDPGLSSSQNEQDSRHYAKFAKIPLLEPSDSQEAKDFVGVALETSERFDVPVLLRLTARLAHTKSIVRNRREVIKAAPPKHVFNSSKYVMIPQNARRRRIFVEERLKALKKFTELSGLNKVERNKMDIGIVTSGACYSYVKECCPEAAILKLGITYPLPEVMIKKFSKNFPVLHVIEELDPFLEEQIAAVGVKVKGKALFSGTGELSQDLIKKGLRRFSAGKGTGKPLEFSDRSARLCPGCAYMGLFYILKKLGAWVIGDIGCYSLCALPPLSSLETCISMGSGLGIAQGLKAVLNRNLRRKVVGVIGDSTMIHAGIPALINSIYNKEFFTTVILDNQATAMTGGQGHPGTGINLKKEKTSRICFEKLARSLGIKKVCIINAYDLGRSEKILRAAMNSSRPSVIIAKNPCMLQVAGKQKKKFEIDPFLCNNCKKCLQFGCSSLVLGKGKPKINLQSCAGCSLCWQICPRGAIKEHP